MRLRQSGKDLSEVTKLERRASDPPGGPDLLWFHVQPGTPIDAQARTELVDDAAAIRIQVLQYGAPDPLVIAIAFEQ